MFVCGSGSFGHQEEDIDDCPITSPNYKKPKRSTSFCKIIGRDNGTKNPYSDRGLDKFNELLAYLDDKKQQIYTKKGSDHISYVRFAYTNDSKRIKPIIVVKKMNKQDLNRPKDILTSHARVTETELIYSNGSDAVQSQVRCKIDTSNKYTRYGGRSFGVQEDLKQPCYSVPLIFVLILVCLAMFGRIFAIFCTVIMWYLTPMIGGSSKTKSSKRGVSKLKKEYVKEASANNLVLVPCKFEGPSSPTSVIPSALTDNEINNSVE